MSKVIKKETITRLVRDIKDVIKNPLEDIGIYYKHDDTDMLKGYALIIGPADTPYQDGNYLFELNYPTEYPFLPPKVTYCTNLNGVRFNPNLYRNGKVCLSILNTWKGDQWTSCETIRSILLSLFGVFTPVPLLNEPGVTSADQSVEFYTDLITYCNFEIAIGCVVKNNPRDAFPISKIFHNEIETHFRENKDKIIERARAYCNSREHSIYRLEIPMYGTSYLMNFPELLRKIESI